MKKYKIQDREAGNVIEENLTFEQAQEMVLAFVKADKKEGNYTPEFYEIKEMGTKITFSKWELNKPFEGDNRPFISEGDTIICYMVPNPSASLNNQPTMDAQAQAIASLPDIVRENEELKAINAELLEAAKLVMPILENPENANEYLFRKDILKEAIAKATK